MTEDALNTSDETTPQTPVEEQDPVETEETLQEQDDNNESESILEDNNQPLPVQDDQGETVTVESVIEAVLFASDEPVSGTKLAGIVEQTSKNIRRAIAHLNHKYQEHGHAFRIDQIAGGWQMLTLPAYMTWLKKLVRIRGDSKLSPAALETLAIVAYKQPVIRADMEAIRGVACGEVLRSLMGKGLIKMIGRAEVVGRPMQYGTTKKFLTVFGLNSLKDLPTIEELKRPEATNDSEPDSDEPEESEETTAVQDEPESEVPAVSEDVTETAPEENSDNQTESNDTDEPIEETQEQDEDRP